MPDDTKTPDTQPNTGTPDEKSTDTKAPPGATPDWVITGGDESDFYMHITAISDLAKKWTDGLAQNQKHKVKFGDKSLAFVDRAREYYVSMPIIRAAVTNDADFGERVKNLHKLWNMMKDFEGVGKRLTAFYAEMGTLAFQDSLDTYEAAKMAASRGVVEAIPVVQELGKRFERHSVHHTEEGSQPPELVPGSAQ